MNKSLFIAWITSIISVLGSLFLSEALHFIPCDLCWYERILMYPLALLLGISFYQTDLAIYKYVFPFSTAGMLISMYHYGIQKIPFLQEIQRCSNGIPCSNQYINWFGFITIPLLAFIAFAIINIIMVLIRRQFKS